MAQLLLDFTTACRFTAKKFGHEEETMNPDVSSAMNDAGRSSARKGLDRPFHRRKDTAAMVSHIDTGLYRDTARYLASLSIIVLAFRDNDHAAVIIPAWEIFEVMGPSPDDRFTIVKVKSEELLVFRIGPEATRETHL